MKRHLWIIIIIVIALLALVVFFADDVRLLFLPQGNPPAKP